MLDVPEQGLLPMMELVLKGGTDSTETCVKTYGLVDSGSTVSLLPTDLCEKLSLPVFPCREGTTLKILGEITVVSHGVTSAAVEFGVSTIQVNFQVVQTLPAPIQFSWEQILLMQSNWCWILVKGASAPALG